MQLKDTLNELSKIDQQLISLAEKQESQEVKDLILNFNEDELDYLIYRLEQKEG